MASPRDACLPSWSPMRAIARPLSSETPAARATPDWASRHGSLGKPDCGATAAPHGPKTFHALLPVRPEGIARGAHAQATASEAAWSARRGLPTESVRHPKIPSPHVRSVRRHWSSVDLPAVRFALLPLMWLSCSLNGELTVELLAQSGNAKADSVPVLAATCDRRPSPPQHLRACAYAR